MKNIIIISILLGLSACVQHHAPTKVAHKNKPIPIADLRGMVIVPLQSNDQTPSSRIRQCPKQRAAICGTIYLPVCVLSLIDPKCQPNRPCTANLVPIQKTYSSACSACRNIAIKQYSLGACRQ